MTCVVAVLAFRRDQDLRVLRSDTSPAHVYIQREKEARKTYAVNRVSSTVLSTPHLIHVRSTVDIERWIGETMTTFRADVEQNHSCLFSLRLILEVDSAMSLCISS